MGDPAKRLHRSSTERIVAGVAGGLAEYFGVDPVLMRLAFVLLTFAGGSGLVAYLVLAFIMPLEHAPGPPPPEDVVREVREGMESAAEAIRGEFRARGAGGWFAERRNLAGLVLIALGVAFLLPDVIPVKFLGPDVLWPLALVGVGVLVILGGSRRG